MIYGMIFCLPTENHLTTILYLVCLISSWQRCKKHKPVVWFVFFPYVYLSLNMSYLTQLMVRERVNGNSF